MESLWLSGKKTPEFPALEGDTHTDVLIIGGGIAGLLTAYMLHQKGVRYLLLEKGKICHGTTGNTTAKITVQHGLVYSKILREQGAEKARMYLTANAAAFDKYAGMCKNIDCCYEVKDNYVYSVDNRQKLEDELSALQKIGFNAEYRSSLPIPVKNVGAVCFPEQAQFDPVRFLAEISGGLNICEDTFVRELAGNTAVTDRGSVRADRIVIVTHFPIINKHGSYFLKMYQHRSYVLALENAADVDGMYVDENRSGFSFRNAGEYLLLGGGGHRTGKPVGGWDVLRGFAQRHYPHCREVYRWAAQDCLTLDDIPYIGEYSLRTHNMYVATGFGKWGMTGAMTAAMLLSGTLTGETPDWGSVFSPSRSMMRSQLAANGAEAVKGLLTPSKKRCPHMGCALKWNPAERSWDCSCHGSRFSERGTELDNPANGDLRNM